MMASKPNMRRYGLNVFYARLDYYRAHHYRRWARRVMSRIPRLMCQDCRGVGTYYEPIPGMWENGPSYPCGWCEGTGYLDSWHRGLWLRLRRAS